MKTIISKKWTENYVGRFGCPDGKDECYAEIVKYIGHNGREYLRETVTKNNVTILSMDYPAGNAYAEKRVAMYS